MGIYALHVFNSSLISGPETLVIPALAQAKFATHILWLRELRTSSDKQKKVESYLQQSGVNYSIVDIHSRTGLVDFKVIAQQILQLNPQIIHAHDVKASWLIWGAKWFLKSKPFKYLSTHHGVRARSGRFIKLYENIYVRLVLPFFDRTLTVCRSDEELLIKRGLAPFKLKTHLNGVTRNLVSWDHRQAHQSQIRQQWQLKNSKLFTIGVVARLALEKRHPLIIEAAIQLKKINPQFQILFFGVGPDESTLRRLVKSHQLESHIIFMGYRSEIPNEYAGFDLLLSLSEAEGLPINLIEAGWAGVAVAATLVDGVSDLLPNDQLAIRWAKEVTPEQVAQDICQIMDRPEQLQKMGQNFQSWVSLYFNQNRWLQDLTQNYDEVNQHA